MAQKRLWIIQKTNCSQFEFRGQCDRRQLQTGFSFNAQERGEELHLSDE